MRRALSGLAALAALVVFFVAVPAVLVVLVGRPVPALATVRAAVELRYLPNELVRQVAACVAWLGWAWLLLAALRMAVAAWQDRPIRPAAGTAWMLPWVRRATAAVVLCSGLLGRTPAWSAPAVSPVPAAATAQSVHKPPPRPTPPHITSRELPGSNGDGDNRRGEALGALVTASTTLRMTSLSPAAGQTYRVQQGDVLWDIAAKQLKDPLQWKAIWDLNRGRVLADSEGGHRVFTDPKLILPGWQLLMPVGWSASTSTQTPALSTAAPPVPAAPAARTEASPPATRSPFTPPSTAAPSNGTATPAAHTTPPPSTAAARTNKFADPARARLEPSAPIGTDHSEPNASTHRPSSPGLPIGIELPIGAGLAGGSIVLLLARMRRGQAARCQPGRRIRLPDPALGNIEAALAAASPTDPHWVEAVIRLGGDHLAALDTSSELLGVLVDNAGAKVILSSPEPAASPFRRAARGWSISHSSDEALAAANGQLCTTPVLVSVGTTRDGADLLVNLEAAGGSIDLVGRPDEVAGLAATMALGLASAPWADGIQILAWGDLATTLGGLDRVAELTPHLLDQALRQAVDSGRSAADVGADNVAAARRAAPGGPWAPTAIISAVPLPSELAARTAQAAALRAGLVVAAPDQPSGSTKWTIGPEGLKLLGMTVTPHRLDEPVRASIAALVATATQSGDVAVTDVPYAALAATPAAAQPLAQTENSIADQNLDVDDEASACVDADDESFIEAPRPLDGKIEQSAPATLRLDLLGPVNLAGCTAGVPRPKVIEVLAFLASWQTGATTDQVTEALWPGKPPAPKTVYNLLNETRRYLGNSTGENPLHQVGRRWVLSLPTDLDHFRDLVTEGYPIEALRLIRGRPYDMLGDPVWAVVQGHVASTEGMVVDVAVEVASAALAAGNRPRVEEAAKAGLSASPYHEELHELRIRAAEQAGEHARARTLKAERDACLEDEVAPYDQPRLALS